MNSFANHQGLLGIVTAYDTYNPPGSEFASALSAAQSIQERVSPFQTAIVGKALTNGYAFEGIGNSLLSLYEPLFRQQGALEEAQSSVRSLIEANMTFAERLNTSVYMARPNSSLLDTVSGSGRAAQGIAGIVDTSWMRDPNPWETQAATLINTSVGSMYERDNLFAKLIDAENETGRLLYRMENAGIAGAVTSAATQMASLLEAIRGDSEDGLRGFNGIADIVTGYGDFALSQHKWIQEALEAGNSRDADWRIGLLDVTSKFVDRQVMLGSGVESALAQMEQIDLEAYVDPIEKDFDYYEFVDRGEGDTDFFAYTTSFFTAIPQEIGYTKREDAHITQEEALKKSKIVTIPELGYGIVDRVLALNKIQEDHFRDLVFKPTSKTFWMMGKLGRFICDDAYKFESMINHMYFLIYENQNGIKKLLGNGSSTGISTPDGKGVGGCLYGKRVFVTDMTFDASVNPVMYEGGEPVFIDSEYETWNMAPKALRKAFEIYPDVKIVIFVHLYGVPGKIDECKRICEEYGAILIEDAAESLGAYTTIMDRKTGEELKVPTGSIGDYGIISMNGNKIITGSSGGALIVPDEYSYNKAKKWSTQARESAPRYEHEELASCIQHMDFCFIVEER